MNNLPVFFSFSDEYTLGNRRIYETLDRSFRDLLKNDLPFGDKLILFSGNWNQCLPVVPNADRANIVAQTMKASCLWDHVQHLRLTENMRVKNAGKDDQEYAQYLDDVGDGKIETHPDIEENMIKIPEQMVSKSETINNFVDEIFPMLGEHIEEALKHRDTNPDWNEWVHKRTIVCSRNDDVEEVNRICLDKMKGQPQIYRSADKTLNEKDANIIPVEFLNKSTPSGCPPHCLVVKMGAPIILMRNLDPNNGHVNGAR